MVLHLTQVLPVALLLLVSVSAVMNVSCTQDCNGQACTGTLLNLVSNNPLYQPGQVLEHDILSCNGVSCRGFLVHNDTRFPAIFSAIKNCATHMSGGKRLLAVTANDTMSCYTNMSLTLLTYSTSSYQQFVNPGLTAMDTYTYMGPSPDSCGSTTLGATPVLFAMSGFDGTVSPYCGAGFIFPEAYVVTQCSGGCSVNSDGTVSLTIISTQTARCRICQIALDGTSDCEEIMAICPSGNKNLTDNLDQSIQDCTQVSARMGQSFIVQDISVVDKISHKTKVFEHWLDDAAKKFLKIIVVMIVALGVLFILTLFWATWGLSGVLFSTLEIFARILWIPWMLFISALGAVIKAASISYEKLYGVKPECSLHPTPDPKCENCAMVESLRKRKIFTLYTPPAWVLICIAVLQTTWMVSYAMADCAVMYSSDPSYDILSCPGYMDLNITVGNKTTSLNIYRQTTWKTDGTSMTGVVYPQTLCQQSGFIGVHCNRNFCQQPTPDMRVLMPIISRKDIYGDTPNGYINRNYLYFSNSHDSIVATINTAVIGPYVTGLTQSGVELNANSWTKVDGYELMMTQPNLMRIPVAITRNSKTQEQLWVNPSSVPQPTVALELSGLSSAWNWITTPYPHGGSGNCHLSGNNMSGPLAFPVLNGGEYIVPTQNPGTFIHQFPRLNLDSTVPALDTCVKGWRNFASNMSTKACKITSRIYKLCEGVNRAIWQSDTRMTPDGDVIASWQDMSLDETELDTLLSDIEQGGSTTYKMGDGQTINICLYGQEGLAQIVPWLNRCDSNYRFLDDGTLASFDAYPVLTAIHNNIVYNNSINDREYVKAAFKKWFPPEPSSALTGQASSTCLWTWEPGTFQVRVPKGSTVSTGSCNWISMSLSSQAVGKGTLVMIKGIAGNPLSTTVMTCSGAVHQRIRVNCSGNSAVLMQFFDANSSCSVPFSGGFKVITGIGSELISNTANVIGNTTITGHVPITVMNPTPPGGLFSMGLSMSTADKVLSWGSRAIGELTNICGGAWTHIKPMSTMCEIGKTIVDIISWCLLVGFFAWLAMVLWQYKKKRDEEKSKAKENHKK